MPGIIHFDRFSREQRPVSRRQLMIGTAGYAGAAAFGTLSVTARGGATPAATPGETKGPVMGMDEGKARERLKGLLSLVPPDLMGGPDPNSWLFSWLDLQSHLAALGGPNLMNGSSPVTQYTGALFSPDPLFSYALMPEARTAFGFSSLEIHQTLVVGMPPDQVTIYAGGAPVPDLPAIWEASGYERKSGQNGEYWTVGENGEINLDSPVGRFGTGMLNNVAIVNDDVMVFAPRIELVEAVLVTAREGGASAAEDAGMPDALGAMPVDAVNVIAIPGGGLDASTIVPENPGGNLNQSLRDLLAESDDAVGPMPVSQLAFFGITAGAIMTTSDASTPVPQGNAAVIFVDLVTGSPQDAAQAATVVDWRVQNMTSPVAGYAYSELLTPVAGEGGSAGAVATLSFTSPKAPGIWSQIVMRQDLWPFVYVTGE